MLVKLETDGCAGQLPMIRAIIHVEFLIRFTDPVVEDLTVHPTLPSCDILVGQMFNILKKRGFFNLPIINKGSFSLIAIAAVIRITFSLLFFPPKQFCL